MPPRATATASWGAAAAAGQLARWEEPAMELNRPELPCTDDVGEGEHQHSEVCPLVVLLILLIAFGYLSWLVGRTIYVLSINFLR